MNRNIPDHHRFFIDETDVIERIDREPILRFFFRLLHEIATIIFMVTGNPDDLLEIRIDLFEELGDIRILGCSVFLQLFDLDNIARENEAINVVRILDSEFTEFEM